MLPLPRKPKRKPPTVLGAAVWAVVVAVVVVAAAAAVLVEEEVLVEVEVPVGEEEVVEVAVQVVLVAVVARQLGVPARRGGCLLWALFPHRLLWRKKKVRSAGGKRCCRRLMRSRTL